MPLINTPGSTRFGVAFNTSAATADQVAATLNLATPEDATTTVTAVITAVATDNGDEGQSYGIVGTFLNDGGTVAQVGSTTALWTHETVGGRSVDFNLSTSTLQIRVSPSDATPLTWMVSCDVWICQQWIDNMGFVE
jgi:hypothetical protein